jgi:hypothetical protein
VGRSAKITDNVRHLEGEGLVGKTRGLSLLAADRAACGGAGSRGARMEPTREVGVEQIEVEGKLAVDRLLSNDAPDRRDKLLKFGRQTVDRNSRV